MNEQGPIPETHPQIEGVRRPYTRPSLIEYGRLQDLTQAAIGVPGAADMALYSDI